MSTERRFEIWDVFTDRVHTGNPLAVVLDAAGLNAAAMQDITREFNLSETAFVFPARGSGADAALRIFTPGFEVPFAGHPTVGSAISIARLRQLTGRMRLELPSGLFDIRLEQRDGMPYAEFTNPNLPALKGEGPAAAIIEAALSLPRGAINVGAHKPRRVGAGVDFFYANASLAHVQAARLNLQAWEAVDLAGAVGLVLYAETGEPATKAEAHLGRARFHVRMFAPNAGITEDPATGAAAAALPGQIHAANPLADGQHLWRIDQGIEMGRPSRIDVTVNAKDGEIAGVRVGGCAIRVAEGRLFI